MDNTTVIGLISCSDESEYRIKAEKLEAWCRANNLQVKKTKANDHELFSCAITFILTDTFIYTKAYIIIYIFMHCNSSHTILTVLCAIIAHIIVHNTLIFIHNLLLAKF